MIQYRVEGNIIQYNNADDVKLHSYYQLFKDSANPINARDAAFRYWSNIILEMSEADKDYFFKHFKRGGDPQFDIGLGVAIYLEAENEKDEIWDKLKDELKLTFDDGFLGWVNEPIDEEEEEQKLIGDFLSTFKIEDDIPFTRGDAKWIIIGDGSGFYFQPSYYFNGLVNEIKIYDYFKYDKAGKEIDVTFFDIEEKKEKKHKILFNGFDWNKYNSFAKDYSLKHDQKVTPEKEEDILDEKTKEHLNRIKGGEGKQVEFKSTLCYNLAKKQIDIAIKYEIAKTIVAFLNTSGGLLYIGVNDNGEILGLNNDYKVMSGENKVDGFNLTFASIIRDYIGRTYHRHINCKIHTYNNLQFMAVEVFPARLPVVLSSNGTQELYVRLEGSSQKLNVREIIDWMFERYPKLK